MSDSEIEFFTQDFVEEFFGGHISFTQGRTGTWALGQKLNERHDQSTKEEFEAYGAPSAAYGTFECFNVDDPGGKAIMRISMQIPYAGPAFQSARTRARQASNQLTSYSRSELEACQKLRQHGSRLTPTLINQKRERQGQSWPIPSGFLFFLITESVSGIPLEDVYWDLDPQEREAIRQGFRLAWVECLRAGVICLESGLDNLVWDSEKNAVYILRFIESCPAESTDQWKDVEWIAWGLAEPPRGYRWSEEEQVHPDTSSWRL